jgi:hypothetical protein
MNAPFPQLKMNDRQVASLTAQLLVYQQYLQRKVAPSAKRNRSLRIVVALTRRLSAIWQQTSAQIVLLLTVEEVALMKEALTVMQQVLETKPPSSARSQEIERIVAMKTLIEQTFPTIQN